MHIFTWYKGVFSDLGTYNGYGTFAYAINNLGHILGGIDFPYQNGTVRVSFLYANGNVQFFTDLTQAF